MLRRPVLLSGAPAIRMEVPQETEPDAPKKAQEQPPTAATATEPATAPATEPTTEPFTEPQNFKPQAQPGSQVSQGGSRTRYANEPSTGGGSRTRFAGPFRILPVVASAIPFHTTCPYCGNYVLTTTKATPGLLSWLLCTTLMLLGCVLGCCLLPFCIEELMDVRHRCPVCRNHLYRFRRL